MSVVTDRCRRAIAAAFGATIFVAAWVVAATAADTAVTIKGLVFLPQAEDVRPGGVPEPVGQIDASRVPALADPGAQTEIRRYLGLPVSEILIGSLRAAVGKHYSEIGRPFVSVLVPKQDVTDGVIQVVVLEARLGGVTLEGDRWFSPDQYLGSFRLKPGDPIDNRTLQADLDWINRNQYRRVTTLAAAGAQTGSTDLTLRTQEQFPLSVTSGADNTGNFGTGLYRLYTGFDWGDALWRGDDFNYRFTSSAEMRLLRQHSFSYTSYLPWRDTLTLSGAIVETSEASGGSAVTTDGRNDYASLRYQSPLPNWGMLTQSVSVGYDFKSSNNNILFGGSSVFPTTTEVDQFLGIYSGQLPDELGSTGVTLTLVGSPGGLTAQNTTAAFGTQQAGATANYLYGSVVVDRLTNVSPSLSWYARGTLQLSDATLLPSEQMPFGGPQSNRGAVTAGATRDNGFQLINELRAPALTPALPHAFGLEGENDQLVPFLFLDYGAGWNHLTHSSSWMEMTTIGPGFSYQFSRFGTIRFTYGFPLQLVGHTAPILRPQFSATFTF